MASHSQVAPGREPSEVTGLGEPTAEQAGLGLRPEQSASRHTGTCGYGWVPLRRWGERGASGSSMSVPQGCCHLRETHLRVTCSGPNCCQESSLGSQPGTPPRCATDRSRSRWRSLWAERSVVNRRGRAREGQQGCPSAVYTGGNSTTVQTGSAKVTISPPHSPPGEPHAWEAPEQEGSSVGALGGASVPQPHSLCFKV